MRKLFFLIALTFLALQITSQNVIQGKVTDENDQPLSGAYVTLKPTSKTVITNRKGEFQFNNLTDEAYTVLVKYIGYENVEKNVKTGSSLDISMERSAVSLEEVTVSATRASDKTPIAYNNLNKDEIRGRNLGQDIPYLMNYLPGVVTTSDAGAGVGYTGIRVRGSDATRVNVTVNGIPYNDAESQGAFWVDVPDFVSSVENLQLQRGVGTSTNGSGAFGASLNLLTDVISKTPYAEISNSYGSFNTHKHTLKMSTGLLNNCIEINGRLSKIGSDGYIDRAWSNMDSYFLQGTYYKNKTLIKALYFGGKERTYQAWNGIDSLTLATNRRYNPSGSHSDANGKEIFYDNETDNYWQTHYQLHWNQEWDKNWSSHIALHYTQGNGYYENYKTDRYSDYGLTALPLNLDGKEMKAGIIRQKWLDNDFYGTVFSANYNSQKINFIFGGGANNYIGRHFGNILWTEIPRAFEYDTEYYRNKSDKYDANIYAKATYSISEKWSAYGDLQYRYVHYKSKDLGINDNFNFFNPKAGINFILNQENNFYFSYAMAHREPNRDDYENNETKPKPEELNDFELGWKFVNSFIQLNSNIYYMLYNNQLVLTGRLDDVGDPIRTNSGKSYRVGLEIDAQVSLEKHWVIRPNISISQNKNIDFYIQEENGTLKNLGKTNISYSPNIVAGNILTYSPIETLHFSLLSKYVGEQYMSNIDLEASKLKAYFVNDFNANYEIKTNKILKSIDLSLLINNIFNVKYVSNGYMWDIYPYYFPQAGTNVLGAVTLRF